MQSGAGNLQGEILSSVKLKILSRVILLAFLCSLPFSIYGQGAEDAQGLVVRGRVLDIQLTSPDKNYVNVTAQLNLDFTNAGDEPIIILQPVGKEHHYIFWQAGVVLTRTREPAYGEKEVLSSGLLPSVYKFPFFRELGQRLDKPAPPAGLTRTLQPKETWSWNPTIFFKIASKADYSMSSDLGWEEIGKIDAPLWMRVSYSIFPSNIGSFNKNLGEVLQRRWRKYGRLWFDSTSPHNTITSEPMLLELNKNKGGQ